MIWRLRFCNKDGIEARVEIQRGASTPIIDVEGTGNPFTLSYNNDKGNKSGMFLASSADIEIYETTDFNIDNLKTSDEAELAVTYYINDIVKWKGFIIPDFFSIEVRSNPVIAMTASDRLGTLKNATLSDLPSMITLRELAILCLNKTGLTLPLKTMADFSNDGTNNAFFSYYIDSQRIKDVKGRAINCYDILSSILTASNSKLLQRGGEWIIINKLQHEIGSGKLYSDTTTFTNYLENIYNFNEVNIGARRTITPVAGSVGIYHEHGGRKSHPVNYDYSLGLSGWNSVNDFVATIEDRHITGFLGGTPLFDPERTVKQYLLNYNNWIDDTTNLNTAPYIETDAIPINSTRADRVEVTVDISSTMAEKLSSNTTISFLRYAVILTNGVKTYTLTKAGIFEELDPENISGHSLLLRGGQQSPLLLASPAFSNSDSFKGLFEVGESDNVNDYSATIRIYGSGEQYVTVNYAIIKFSDVSELPKGTMYKTEQTNVFTKAYAIETSIFGDYLLSGLDGYFYRYPNDDTSSIYKDVNTLSTPIWTTPNIPNETSELPLLHHSMRQIRRMFSVAHDLLSAEIEIDDFDPLAIFVACDKRYTVVSGSFDFFRSNVKVELEEVAFQNTTVREYIYSYFGEGDDNIKSIGGVSGGTGGGGTSGGGGMTSEQLEMLTNLASWWKLDEENDAIYSEKNVYSLKGLSALGLGDGGGGGGDFDRLDAWADYDSTKSGWVLSALLGVDLNDRLSNVEGGSATSVNVTGTGDVIVDGSKSGNVITLTRGNQSWDNLSGKPATFTPAPHTHSTSDITSGIFGIARIPTGTSGSTVALGNHLHTGVYEPVFTKNTAFNKNFGTTVGTVAQGNDSRIINGQTAYEWGDHASAGYALNSALTAHTGNSTIHITSTERTNWNLAYANTHTHGNKGVIDALTQGHINVLNKLSLDAQGNVKVDATLWATGGLSALGLGEDDDSGGGGGVDMLDSWANYTSEKANYYVPASLLVSFRNDTLSRLTSLESGSATSIETTGSGNAITSVSKSGNTLTFAKESTFSLSTHTHTIAQITGLQTALDSKEPAFSKNTAFNKNFGTAAGTVAQGNDSRIINGQTAYGWGNHASAGYALNSALSNYLPLAGGTMSNTNLVTNLNADLLDGYHASETAATGLIYTYRAAAVGGTNFWHRLGTLTLPAVTGSGRSKVIAQITGLANFGTNEHRILILKASTRGSVGVNGLMIKGNSTDVRVGYVNNGSAIEIWVGYVGFYNTDTNVEILNSANFTVNRVVQTSMPDNFVTCPILVSATTASNVASATKLQTARTIAGVSFDGTANIAIPFANLSSKPSTLGGYGITDAVTINTPQTISGEKTFTGNVIIKGNAGNSPLKVRGIDGYIDSTGLLDNLYLNLVSTKDIIMVRGGGNVSIGVASPSYKLDVEGAGRFTSSLITPIFRQNSALGGLIHQVSATTGNLSQVWALGTTNQLTSETTPNTSFYGIATRYVAPNRWFEWYGGGVLAARIGLHSGDGFFNGNVGIGTTSPSEKLHVAGNILATGPITTPKVIFNAAGWSMEQVGSELQLKHNGVIKQRMLSNGTILATGGITALST